ncbi:SusD/RagB family nutrient-binding outer membrane lipoprotein [Tenacibaculum finnmarkense]|uniref:SusD/RagB family nutrient-binding outer membrane lipoprotein n=1 Tax=Tenacibaculum finnmarkense TaxID=2781243 RepID=UPI001E49E50A|nr:SusD/RagB family nutrient-binding outer membrane lipoprotein [Tenacibaculum finnmarkense]MCD8403670.1 SusD/RagB family nutrient-binding outer membrane lipoprotein [Tenacibaculum finnmarkense genomovar finnmarkense]
MKNLKNILTIGTISLLTLASCTKDLESLNIDPKHPTLLPSSNLLATSLSGTATQIYTPSVNYNNYRFFVQHITEAQYTDESNYDLLTRNQPRRNYDGFMTRGINNIKLAKESLANETNSAAVQKNKLATLEIQEIFVWETLVDTYGDLPYTEALDNVILSPKYDDAFTIYKDLISRIDKAASMITVSASGYGKSDFIYNGNMNKWKKFANSIKLRLGINLADFDSGLSKKIVESAFSAGIISNDSESYTMIFDGGTFSNPVFEAFVNSGRDDFMPSKGIIDFMNEKNDPRRAVWFSTVNVIDSTVTPPVKKDIYKGGVIGDKNTFSDHSHYTNVLTNASAPAKLLSFTEVQLILTEAAARGYNVGGTAEELYKKAIKASMDEYDVSAAEATTYLNANPYDASKWKEIIAEQAWVSLFDRAFATWNFTRRLDLNKFITPTKNELKTIVPFRMPYSDKEYQLNKTNVKAAATAIGGDKAETKLFWDKY